jgi:hypothetical protein
MSRDLIDLAVLRLYEGQSEPALSKAEKAYPVLEPLTKAVAVFQSSHDYRDKCFSALEVRDRITIMKGIELLAQDLMFPPPVKDV